MLESKGNPQEKKAPEDAKKALGKAKDAIEKIKKIASAAYVMDTEMDCSNFHSTIFSMDATERGFVQTVFCVPETTHGQTLEDCCEGGKMAEEIERALTKWSSYASIGGVAQYSLWKRAPIYTSERTPAGVLGKFDIEFRPASPEEAHADFERFGEQVVPKTWADADERERKTGTKINFLGEDFLYDGPLRVAGFHFTTRVFGGEFPDDISQAIAEVNENAPKRELIVHQGYHFFHADNGRIMYSAFFRPEEYCAGKSKLFGDVIISDGRMAFFPNGNRVDAKDFSDLLMKEWIY